MLTGFLSVRRLVNGGVIVSKGLANKTVSKRSHQTSVSKRVHQDTVI